MKDKTASGIPVSVARDPGRQDGRRENPGERGAILILALAYILIMGVVVAALTTWASGDLNNTARFNTARNTDYALSSAVEVAMNNIRYTPVEGSINANPPVACWGSGTYATTSTASYATYSTYSLPNSGVNVATWCTTRSDPGSANTRIVSIYACTAPATSVIATTWATPAEIENASSVCAAGPPGLEAIVVFDDYSTTGQYVPGEGASLQSWDFSSLAQSTSLPNSISVTSTPLAYNTIGSSYTPTATATSGDTVQVTTKNASICSAVNGVVTFVSNGSCVIYFNDPGNVNYESALTQSQTMTVGLQANAITITSAAPGSAEVGQNYAPSASAISGDAVTITADASSSAVCTSSANTIYFVGTGTCQVDFNDPGNSQYQAAAQKTQSFTVTVGPPAGYSILAQSASPNGLPNNGDVVSYTYNEPMKSTSILTGWSGSSTAVYVQLSRQSGSQTIWTVCTTSTCSGTAVNLGTVNLGDTGSHYVQTSGTTYYFNATMLLNTTNGQSVVTVTLGTNVGSAPSTVNSTTTLKWTPSASAVGSLNSQACSTSTVTEANAPINNF